MTNKNRSVFNRIRQVARENVPEGSIVLLFGSRARGEAKKGSDWDVLIVLPKDQLRQEDYDRVSYPLVELGWMIGEQINPIVYTQREWEANSITPFYDNVQHDGVSLLFAMDIKLLIKLQTEKAERFLQEGDVLTEQ